jgi:hypothetical protein
MSITLFDFKLDMIKKNSAILINTNSNRECKTSQTEILLTRHLLSYFKNKVVNCTMISKEYEETSTENLIPTYPSLTLDIASDIIERNTNVNVGELVVIENDDFINSEDKHSTEIQKLLFENEKYNITYVLTLNYPHEISERLQHHFDYVFIMPHNYNAPLYREYPHLFNSYEHCEMILNSANESNSIVVLDIWNRGVYQFVIPSILKVDIYTQLPEFQTKMLSDNYMVGIFGNTTLKVDTISKILLNDKYKEKVIISKNHHGFISPNNSDSDSDDDYMIDYLANENKMNNDITHSSNDKKTLLTKIRENDHIINTVSKIIENKKSSVVVFEDCISNELKMNDVVCELLYNNIYYNTSCILTHKFTTGLPTNIKYTFDFVFLLYDKYERNQRQMYEEYCKTYMPFEDFKELYLLITQVHKKVMVISRRDKRIFVL